MRVEGGFEVGAPAERVWASFWEPAVMTAWLPGCLHAQWEGDERVSGQVEQSVAQLKARFEFDLRVTQREPERLLRLEGTGRGLTVSSDIALQMAITLAPASAGTRVSYTLDAQISGALATVGNFILKLKSRELERTMAGGVKQALESTA